MFERDEFNYELRIKDTSDELWFMQVGKLRFAEFVEGGIYRIRSVVRDRTSNRNIIQVKNTTNVLKFYKESKIFKEMSRLI